MPLVILVVDDNPGTRLSVHDYLEISGYSVITAEDGQQALSLIESDRPHILVTDINMPRMDGYELVRQVRQKPEFRLLPVVFLTERSSTAERIKGYQSGCDLYLPKPFEMQELGAVIRNLLERQMILTQFSSSNAARFSSTEALPSQVQAPSLVKPYNDTGNAQQKAITPKRENLELTKREQDVLELLTKGRSNVEIGNKLHLSPRTVEKHVSSLLRKTATSKRAELVRFALENRLVE
jgi:DNA-binding NarL/FixJ family response regulator